MSVAAISPGRMRPGEARGIRPHRRQSRRIAEQPIDLPGERREVVAADRHVRLEEMVGVPLLLAGDGMDDHQREAARQGLGAREAPGLADQQVGAAMYSSISVV